MRYKKSCICEDSSDNQSNVQREESTINNYRREGNKIYWMQNKADNQLQCVVQFSRQLKLELLKGNFSVQILNFALDRLVIGQDSGRKIQKKKKTLTKSFT